MTHQATEKDMIRAGWRTFKVGDETFYSATHGATRSIIPEISGGNRYFTPEQVAAIRRVYGEPTHIMTEYDPETHRDETVTLAYTV